MRFYASGQVNVRGMHDFRQTGSSPLDLNYIAGTVDAAALATATPVALTLYAMPFLAPARGGVLDELSFQLTTGAAAGAKARIGLYEATSDTNIYPGRLAVGSAAIGVASGDGTGEKVASVSASLRPGWLYWIAWICSAATANMVRSVSVNGCHPLGIVADMSGTASVVGLSLAAQPDPTSNAMSDPFPSGASAVTAAPILALAYHFSA